MWGWLKRQFRSNDPETVSSSGDVADTNRPKTVIYAKIPANSPEHTRLAGAEKAEVKNFERQSVGGERTGVKAHGVGQTAERRRRRMMRFSKKFSDMTVREARLLFAIHRRTVQSLSKENSAQLQRDLQRFIMSTRGQRMNGRRAAPTITKVRTWVHQAKVYEGDSSGTRVKPQVKAAN